MYRLDKYVILYILIYSTVSIKNDVDRMMNESDYEHINDMI